MAAVDLGMPGAGRPEFREAKRQLDICNSCRYCAGYCPVWTALERRVAITPADVTHFANLCHDCRDCYFACMYTPPHEFGVNPPELFAVERAHTYQRFVWPAGRIRRVAAPLFALLVTVAIALLLVVLSVLSMGGDGGFGSTDGSPYHVVGHWLLVGVVSAPSVYTVAVLVAAALGYWRFTHGSLSDLLRARAWSQAIAEAVTLRHQGGGDDTGCDYPGEHPRNSRRILHHLVAFGFLLTVASTTSAACEQYFFNLLPPYPYLSVPVASGAIGGLSQLIGCAGLIVLKVRSDRSQTTATMWRADFAFLWALVVLNLTGLFVLLLRTSPVFGGVLVVHLAAVIVAFAIAPYTKFVHWIFRVLALYQNAIEMGLSSERAR